MNIDSNMDKDTDMNMSTSSALNFLCSLKLTFYVPQKTLVVLKLTFKVGMPTLANDDKVKKHFYKILPLQDRKEKSFIVQK
jgi:hypothetical protein